MTNNPANNQDKQQRELVRNALFILAFLVFICILAGYAVHRGASAVDVALIGFVAFSAVIVAFAAAVLWQIIKGDIGLYGIIAEPQDVAVVGGKPKASLSRFQFLVFTFVVAGLFLMLSIEAGTFVDIPENVLILIGLSGGSFVVSKAVSNMKSNSPTQTPDAPNTNTADSKSPPSA